MTKLLRLAPVFLGTAACLAYVAFGHAPSAPPPPLKTATASADTKAPAADRPAAATAPLPTATTPLPTATTPQLPGGSELLRLRQVLGSPFAGTVLESADDSEDQAFAAALEDAASARPSRTAAELPAAPSPAMQRALLAPPAATRSPRERVRDWASRIDDLADELEHEEDYYAEADALREIADTLRLRARGEQQ